MTTGTAQPPPETGVRRSTLSAWLGRWPLRTRLALVACIPLCALLLGGLLSLIQLRSANETMGSIYRDRVVPLRQLKQVADAYAVDLVDQTHKVRDGSVNWADARQTLALARQTATAAWNAYLATYLIDDERRLIAIVEPQLARAYRLATSLDELLARQDLASLQRFAARDMYPVVDPLSQAINALVQVQLDESQRLYNHSEAAYRQVMWIMWAALAALLLCAAFFAWVVSHSTMRSIRIVADAATAVAQGDLSQSINVEGGGETGMLLAAIESIRMQLHCSMEEMVQLLEIVPVPMLTARPGRDEVRDVNPAFERHFGLPRNDVVGRALHELPIWLDETAIQSWHRHRQAMEAGGAWLQRAELMMRNRQGDPSRSEVTTMVRRQEHPPAMLMTFEDVTVRRAQEQALKDRAVRDLLTGLPNRAGLEQELANAWDAWRQRMQPFAVMMIDLDGFKPINDHFGHASGDKVLVEVAHRLQALNRASDVCGRWGGDEFVVVLNGCISGEHAAQAVDRVIGAIGQPLNVDDHEFVIGASVGVAHTESDQSSAEDLLQLADQLMYAAKETGKKSVG